MVRRGKFVIGKSKTFVLEQRILGLNEQLTKLDTKVQLISAWISKKFGVSFLVEASARVQLNDVSKYLTMLKSTAPLSLNPAKQKSQSASGGHHHSGLDNSEDEDGIIVISDSDSDVNEAAYDDPTTRGLEDDRAPLEDGEPDREGRTPRKRKSKVQRNKIARLQVTRTRAQRHGGATEPQEGKALANRHSEKRQIERPKYYCNWPRCNKYVSEKSKLAEHKSTHVRKKRLSCTWLNCGKSFSANTDYLKHRRIHTGEKPYVCNWSNCGKSFVQKNHLQTHGRTHTGEKPFVCNSQNCNKSFAHFSGLRYHQRTHTGERPYNCGFCKRRFRNSSHLTSHMRIHTGEKPYKCETCEATFAYSSAKNRHSKSQH